MNSAHFINAFFDPRSVALVGVSTKTGKGAFNVLENLIAYGYKGRIFPVNPKAEEILGISSYKDITSLPGPVDLAMIMTPRERVPEIVAQCAEKGIKAVTITSEGFAEADDQGRRLQRQIDDIVSRNNIRVLGPNSIGIVNAFSRFTTSFMPLSLKTSPVALVSQTGGFFDGFPENPFGKAIDLGNTCDIDFMDAVSYLETDPDVQMIVLHVEGVKELQPFIQTCRRVSKSKPIIAVKGGRSVSGGKAAATHTGAMTGQDRLYQAMFRQCGIIQAHSIDRIGDITKAFAGLPRFTGNRVAVITPTGGGGILALDAIEHYGFRSAVFSNKTIEEMRPWFQPWKGIGNPLDIISAGMAHGYKQVYSKVIETCMKDENVDILFAICGAYTLKTIRRMAEKLPQKPIVAWVIGADQSFIAEKARAYGFGPYYNSPDRALYALKVVREYYKEYGEVVPSFAALGKKED